jgi:hypothetical protein
MTISVSGGLVWSHGHRTGYELRPLKVLNTLDLGCAHVRVVCWWFIVENAKSVALVESNPCILNPKP